MSLTPIGGPIVIDIPADPASLFLVRCLVEKLAQRMELSPEDAQGIILAVNEACTNIVRHVYGDRHEQRILLMFIVEVGRLEIHIRDFGPSADPETFASRDLKDVRPGGLGMHFIRGAMDEVHYETLAAHGGTLLKLIKYRVLERSEAREA